MLNLYEIMMNLDSNNLQKFCYVNKETTDICSDKHFWVKKFEKEKLPIIHQEKTAKGWINEYHAVEKASLKTEEVMQYLVAIDKIYIKEAKDDDEDEVDTSTIYFYLDHFNHYDEMPFLPLDMKEDIKEKMKRYPDKNIPQTLAFWINTTEKTYSIIYTQGKPYSNSYIQAVKDTTIQGLTNVMFEFFYFYYKHHIPVHIQTDQYFKMNMYPTIFKDAIPFPFTRDNRIQTLTYANY